MGGDGKAISGKKGRLVGSGAGYVAGNALDVHFGLGSAATADRVEIFWPSGAVEVVGPLMADLIWEINEGQVPADVPGSSPTVATRLGRAYPNPFNPLTTIEFEVGKPTSAKLEVFTVEGRLVRVLADGRFATGPQRATWDGTDHSGRKVASGTYFYRLTTGEGFSSSGSMVLVK
jgi:hypothetical protein